MKLIAIWKADQNSVLESPHSILWEDGTLATVEEYAEHSLDTHSLVFGPDETIEKHIYPDIVPTVAYDSLVRDWVVSGQNVSPFALGLSNGDATDEEIIVALFEQPMVYKARIVRDPMAVPEKM